MLMPMPPREYNSSPQTLFRQANKNDIFNAWNNSDIFEKDFHTLLAAEIEDMPEVDDVSLMVSALPSAVSPLADSDSSWQ